MGTSPLSRTKSPRKPSREQAEPGVTFVIADPTRLSYFCVSCLDLVHKPFKPKIVWSVEHLALLRVHIATSGHVEYFVYSAAGGLGRRPSLALLPDIGSYFARTTLHRDLVGLLPHGDGEHFVLAVFGCRARSGQDRLHVFRSERGAWTEELLDPDVPLVLTRKTRALVSLDKVIAVGDGALGFVDLFRGILLCNVLDEPVTARYVPLPKLLPNNRGYSLGSLIHPFRDVTCTDGLMIRCVELEDLARLKTSSIPDVSDRDVQRDSELVRDDEEEEYESIGWRLVTWYRILSWDYWRKGSMVHVDDLGTVSLFGASGCGGAGKLPLKDLEISCPTLCGDDVVCLMSKAEEKDQNAWVVTVDTRNKAVGELVPFDTN